MNKWRDLLDGYLIGLLCFILFVVERYRPLDQVIYGKTYLYGGIIFLLLTIYETIKYLRNKDEEDRKFRKRYDERDLEVELKSDNMTLFILKYLVLGLALLGQIIKLDFQFVFLLIYILIFLLPSILRKYYYRKI